jgi:hypothetical protein
MEDEKETIEKAPSNQQPDTCCHTPRAVKGRTLGRVLFGAGGVSALLALLCCAAPWLLGGLLVTLGLGFILRDSVLLSIAAVGIVIAVIGWRLMRKRTSQMGGAA